MSGGPLVVSSWRKHWTYTETEVTNRSHRKIPPISRTVMPISKRSSSDGVRMLPGEYGIEAKARPDLDSRPDSLSPKISHNN